MQLYLKRRAPAGVTHHTPAAGTPQVRALQQQHGCEYSATTASSGVRPGKESVTVTSAWY